MGRRKILCRRPCPFIHLPVCASNGITYDNQCEFENSLCGVPSKEAWTILYERPCSKEDALGIMAPMVDLSRPKRSPKINCNRHCPFIWLPVCGTNGQTYANLCGLEAWACVNGDKSLAVAYEGPCKN